MPVFDDEDNEDVSIFGNAEVFIEKDEEKREWRVFSSGPEKQHLVTIPWAHALKEWPHAKDYDTAVKTCMASNVGLTEDELAEEEAREAGTYSTVVESYAKVAEPNTPDVAKVIPFPKRG